MAKTYADLKGWQPKSFGLVSRASAAYFSSQFAPHLSKTPGTAIEIGFGNGELLGWLKQRGWVVHGVEVSAELVERARSFGIDASSSLSDVGCPSSVQAVFAIDVFEHVPSEELAVLLSNIKHHLVPGGVLIARFPNGDSPYGRYYQHGDRTHCTTIGSGMLRQMVAEAGMSLEVLSAPAPPAISIGLLRWAKHRLAIVLRLIHEIWVGYVYFGGVRVVLSPNLVVVVKAP